jgi:hypothetical protein
MSKRPTYRKRCVECRAWFRPVVRLAKQQQVCGEACRHARRRRQARARRAQEPARYREDERERKRRSRASAATRDVTSWACGHAPGEAPKSSGSQREFDQIWDTLFEASRAAWEREVRKITGQMWRELRRAAALEGARHAPG